VTAEVIRGVGESEEEYVEHWTKIAEHFDIMRWWATFGKRSFPSIYVIACQILPTPESNGGQERTFSAATWIDGKLSKRQSEATFQMKVILHQNKEVLRHSRINFDERYKKMASDSTKNLCKLSDKWREERMQEKKTNKQKTIIEYYPKHSAVVTDDDSNNSVTEEFNSLIRAADGGTTEPTVVEVSEDSDSDESQEELAMKEVTMKAATKGDD
jgi:hAT family C-terminal dimerisation region